MENAMKRFLDAFCMTLNGGLFSNVYIPDDKNSPNCDTFRDIVENILERDDGFSGMSASQVKELDNAKKYLRGRSLLRTDSGGMGLRPDTTNLGTKLSYFSEGEVLLSFGPQKVVTFRW